MCACVRACVCVCEDGYVGGCRCRSECGARGIQHSVYISFLLFFFFFFFSRFCEAPCVHSSLPVRYDATAMTAIMIIVIIIIRYPRVYRR